jgi:Tfp pilus assembly protein PilN
LIKINLIPSRAGAAVQSSTKSSGNNEIQRKGVVNLFLILIFPAALAVFETQTIPQKKIEIQRITKEKREIEAINQRAAVAREELKKIKEDQEKLNSQISVLDGLRLDRDKEVQILDLVQREIPEQIWIQSLDIRERVLKITGYSIKDSDISLFLEKLSKSVILKDISLAKSNQENLPKIGAVKKFEIVSSVDRGVF